MLSSRSLTAYRFATAERPVLPADRARGLLRWRVHRASPAAPGRRRGRSRRMDLVWHREWRGAADRPGRHAHREDGEGRRLHARARLPRQHGSVLLRQPRPRSSGSISRRAAPSASQARASGFPTIRPSMLRGDGSSSPTATISWRRGRACLRSTSRPARAISGTAARWCSPWAGARARRQCALRL